MKTLFHHFLTAINRILKLNSNTNGKLNENCNDISLPLSTEQQKAMMTVTIEKLKQQEKELERILFAVTQKKDEIDRANKLEAMKAAEIAETYKQAVNKLVDEYKAVWEALARLKAANNKDTIKQNSEDEK